MAEDQLRAPLVAGVAFDIPGMGYKNPKTGEIEGFEPNVARALARLLFGEDSTLDFYPVTDEERIPAILSGDADMVLSQLTITPDRLEQVDFSIPYRIGYEGVLVRKGDGIRAFDDLRGKRIAVTESSVSSRQMREALPNAKLVVTKDNSGTFEAVAKGEADAASNELINLRLLRRFAARPDQFEIIDIGDRFPRKPMGVAVEKGRSEFLSHIDRGIERLKRDGEIDRLLRAEID